jgi:pseudouridine-5'-phosphate glycosidase
VIGNPVQQENAMDEAIIQQAISAALKDAAEKEIEGKDVTPFLLERINQLTEGKSLKSTLR